MISDGYELLCQSDLEAVLGWEISENEMVCGCGGSSDNLGSKELAKNDNKYPDFLDAPWG
ncbi:MAG: hypothetical protein EP348_03470 [Alphaproteobacteria bacterium]|nr:MAG: hypothetical protein EP348_03470 [Alphaproteobacteria bacterium]